MDIIILPKVIARLPYALFSPEYKWELIGEVDNVVFPTGTALFGDTLYIYYGAADKRIACASISLSALLAELMSYNRKKMKNKIVSLQFNDEKNDQPGFLSLKNALYSGITSTEIVQNSN